MFQTVQKHVSITNLNNKTMEERKLIEQYFRTKYPNKRYEMKNYYYIEDAFNSEGQKLYVIEFIDSKMLHPKTMELQVKEYELSTINSKQNRYE